MGQLLHGSARMTPAQERLQNHLRRLKLHRMEQVLATVAEDATKTQLS
jgi:hypothetical protein